MFFEDHFQLCDLESWLDPLDSASVECDGMTRLISMLLERERIPHLVMQGRLRMRAQDQPDGTTPAICHWWITLGSDVVVDYRARMWMGPAAPHGVFRLPEYPVGYLDAAESILSPLPIPILEIMSGVSLSQYPPFVSR